MGVDIRDITVESGALPTVIKPRGTRFCTSSVTGTMAAALTANSSVFAMRLDPSAGKNAYIERIRIQFTTIVAFTTAITASRRLALFRGSGAAASSGTAITEATKKLASSIDSEFNAALGGDIRIAATGGLTVTGITYETNPIRTMSLVHVGAAGAFYDRIFEFGNGETAPIVLEPGQLLAVRNPAAMDAAGTWQMAIDVDWFEI